MKPRLQYHTRAMQVERLGTFRNRCGNVSIADSVSRSASVQFVTSLNRSRCSRLERPVKQSDVFYVGVVDPRAQRQPR